MNRKLLIILGIIVAILAVWYTTDRNSLLNTNEDIEIPNTDLISTTTSDVRSGGSDFSGIQDEEMGFTEGGASSAPVPNPPASVFNRSVVASETVKSKISSLSSELKNAPNNLDSWIELGVMYKTAKDYEGARLAYEYAGIIRPNNVTSFVNLGDLYHYYLKDYPKAEKAFETAIANDPAFVSSYVRLFDLYSLSYKTETQLASEILKKGIETNPNSIELMIALGDYYRSKEAYELAKIQYEKALAVAKKANDSAQVSEINNLISKLP